jgi:multidrug efflux pump subunit AcrA (membrane-fusion protein)
MSRLALIRIAILAPVAAVALVATGCSKKNDVKPAEKVAYVTVAKVARQDLPVTESAVGAETAIEVALAYDPTSVRGRTFYVRLPFPEHVAARLRPGQAVTLTGFAEPERAATGRIREIRPALNATTLSRDVIVTVSAGNWHPGGSIRGEVTLGVRAGALVVPEQAVVLRPAGSVVYAIDGEIARQRAVRTGIARAGIIEILDGVKAGETVAVDGAALLSDNAAVRIREPRP